MKRFSYTNHDPATVIAVEWSQMTWAAKMLVWIASPNMARTGSYLAKVGTPYINAQYLGRTREETPKPGAATRWADSLGLVGTGTDRR